MPHFMTTIPLLIALPGILIFVCFICYWLWSFKARYSCVYRAPCADSGEEILITSMTRKNICCCTLIGPHTNDDVTILANVKHPLYVDPQSNCVICLEEMNVGAEDTLERFLQLNCMHKFHRDCIVPWLDKQSKCPLCKQDVQVTTVRTFGLCESQFREYMPSRYGSCMYGYHV